MNKPNNHVLSEQLRERTMKMAVDVRNLLSSLTINPIDKPIVNQLIRCSSSVAANYTTATCSRSDPEFLSKISVVLEEADETKFWIEFLLRIKILEESEVLSLQKEIDELVRIFSSVRKKMKEKTGK